MVKGKKNKKEENGHKEDEPIERKATRNNMAIKKNGHKEEESKESKVKRKQKSKGRKLFRNAPKEEKKKFSPKELSKMTQKKKFTFVPFTPESTVLSSTTV